ncbi:MAG: ATP-grasp domain-containing protein [Patescibacteria group bacterium]|nr:ATP-grasp domain-containing protein [Patescibacteria group bacterium]
MEQARNQNGLGETNATGFGRGVFMFTLDTELAWGMRGDERWTREFESTRPVIKDLLALLEKYDISATWAMVGELFQPGQDPLYHAPELVDWIKDCSVKQEIGSHSFSHPVMDDPNFKPGDMDAELLNCAKVAQSAGVELKSFVYPQNRIAHVDRLAPNGFTSFRGKDRNWYKNFPRILNKIAHVIDEYLVLSPPVGLPIKRGGVWEIPGSYFYPHKKGWAKHLPISARVDKSLAGLKNAVAEKKIFHLWTHPFNLASDPVNLLNGLEEVFKEVSRLREAGQIDVMTMDEIARVMSAKPENEKVLVLDGHLPSSLACVRSLGSKGLDVTCGAEQQSALALHSKSTNDAWVYPSPLADQEAYVRAVESKLKEMGGRPVVFCMSDNTLLPLARNRVRIEAVGRLPMFEEENFNIAFNKALTLKLAEKLGVPAPKTFFVETQADVDQALTELSYPCVIKPLQSCLWISGKGVRGKTEITETREQAKEIVERIHSQTGIWPLLQERLTGQEFGIFGIWQEGRWIVKFAHKRLRSLDPNGGASCLRQSIELPVEMAAYAEKLMSELKWQGPAMVEFKLDKSGGAPKLMEINGRLWGSLALGQASGVDFPYLIYLQACGQTIDPTDQYKVPVTARSFLADSVNLLKTLVKPQGRLRSTALKEFFSSEPNLVYDVESWDDFGPAFWQIINAIARKI